jgi:hypothetical protein
MGLARASPSGQSVPASRPFNVSRQGVPPRRLVAGDFERVRAGATVSGTEGHLTAAGGLYFRGYPEIGSDDPDLYRYCGAGAVVVGQALSPEKTLA